MIIIMNIIMQLLIFCPPGGSGGTGGRHRWNIRQNTVSDRSRGGNLI